MALADTLTPTTDISAATYSTVDWNSKSIRIYKDLAYGTRADQADEGANYVNKAGGKNSYHTHRSGQQYDLYLPASPIFDAPVYLDVHGGSWSECFDKDGSEVELMKSLAARGFVAIGMDYQLQSDIMSKGETTARENATYADMLRDIDAMLQYLKDNEILQSLGASTNKIIIGGTSAGAHLSMMYAWDQTATNHSVALNHPLPIRAVVPVQGPSDFTDPSMMVMAAYFPYLENDAYVAASPELQQMKAYVTLMGWLSNTTLTQENFATEMAKWSPALLINENSCPAILAYSTTNTVDDASAHQSSDGMIPVPLYDSLTNKLTAAGVDYRASLFTGISHGYLAWSENLDSNAGYQWLVPEIANYATNFVESAGGGTGGESGGESGGEEEEPPTGSFAKKVTLTLSADLATTEITTGLPTLVRLSESAIAGFLYSDFQLANGGDLKFTDDAGIEIPHEVDTWNPSGESLVWVRLPSTAAGTAVTMYWGGGEKGALASSAVWSDYVGVWHLGSAKEDGQVTSMPDSSPNGYHALATNNTTSASADGQIGKAWQVSTDGTTSTQGGIVVPGTTNLVLGTKFVVSGWLYHTSQKPNYDHVFYRKTASSLKSGWCSEVNNNNWDSTDVRGANGSATTLKHASCQTKWMHFALAYNNTQAACYQNGDIPANGTVNITAATDNGLPVAFGNDSKPGIAGDISWKGLMDEIRLRKGEPDANYLKAEYNAMNAVFEAGAVSRVDAAEIAFDWLSASVSSSVSVSVPVLRGEGTVSVVYNATVTNELSEVNGEQTLIATPSIPADTIWSVSAYGVSKNGTESTSPAAITVLNGTVNAEKVFDTDELSLSNALFRVVRPSSASATAYPLTVNLAWGGTAVAGTNYVDNLPTSVTIPAGAASVDVPVTPLLDGTTEEATTVTLSIAPGFYLAGAAATASIANLGFPEGFLVWTATAPGLASDSNNWSLRRIPAATDRVLFDGRYSTADCEWDAGASHSIDTLTLTNGYSGTVSVATGYAGDFTAFVCAGDVNVMEGVLSQVTNAVQQESFRLRLEVGGNLVVGSRGAIDVTARGPRGVLPGRAENVHAGDYGTFQSTYGDPKRPSSCGNGNNGNWPSNYKVAGGGAAWLEVTGTVTVNGSLRADGELSNSDMGKFTGTSGNICSAAGSIYLKASALEGSGIISASSDKGCNQDNKNASGGRIGIELTETAYDFDNGGITFRTHSRAYMGNAGHGTLVIRNPGEANGTLYVLGRAARMFSYNICENTRNQTTSIPKGATWTFDKVVIGNYGQLSVGSEATLELPNGWASVVSGNCDTYKDDKNATQTFSLQKKLACGIILRKGGRIVAPAVGGKHEFKNGNWTFHSATNYVLDADTEVSEGASIGTMWLSSDTNSVMRCDVTVVGNLDIKSSGYMNAIYGGLGGNADGSVQSYVPFRLGAAFGTGHGGQNGSIPGNNAYGSFFNPVLAGTAAGHADYRYVGGGAIKATVTGTLNVDGKILASSGHDGSSWGDRPPAPGSINLKAAELTGTGVIRADGAAGYYGPYVKTALNYGPSGGGRVAIHLTGKGKSFEEFGLDRISAKGYTYTGTANGGANSVTNFSSAGTVYLELASEQARTNGTLLVRNDGVKSVTNLAWTSFPAAAETEAPEAFKHVTLELKDAGRVRFFKDVLVNALLVPDGSAIDLNGQAVVVRRARLGGQILGTGRYAASDLAVSDYVVDSSEAAGSLTVIGSGMTIRVR